MLYSTGRTDIYGALAQQGERQVRNLEVRGSIPLCSTKQCKSEPFIGFEF